MQKRIAILLNGEIKNDSRVIKTIVTLSKFHLIDLYYINGDETADALFFNDSVTLNSHKHNINSKVLILRHSLFCYEFNFFKQLILKSGTKYDAVWANDLPTLYPAFKICQKLDCQLIFDSHEIYTETINQFFPRNPRGLKKMIFSFLARTMKSHGQRIEKKIFPSIHNFITVNESLLSYFQSKYPIENGSVIMNVPNLLNANQKDAVNYNLLFDWGEASKIILYQGNLNEGRGIQFFVPIMKLLSNDYKLVVIGDGPMKSGLIDTVKKMALEEQIKFIDSVPVHELNSYTRGAHLGVNFLESFNLSKKLASPNKLFEYIHAGIPVIASNTAENTKVLEKFQIGELTTNNPEEIAQNIFNIFRVNQDKFKEHLSRAKGYYNWENQEQLLLSIVEK